MTLPRPEPSVVADANVLHSNDQRNVLMTLATERQIDLRWTDEIEAEWVGSLVRRMQGKEGGDATRIRAELTQRFTGTAQKMREALPEHALPGYRGHMDSVPKADAKDRHVAAAAVCCAPSHLLTWNLNDFDGRELADLGVTLQDPDGFLSDLFARKGATVHGAVVRSHDFVRSGYAKRGRVPPTWDEYLDILATRGAPNALPRFAAALRTWRSEDSETAEAETGPDASDDIPGPGRR